MINVQEILIAQLTALLSGYLGLILGLVLTAGLGLIALYFLSAQFRRAYNLFNPPRGPQARYGKGNRVYRSGWAFNEEGGRWVYVRRSDDDERPRPYNRSYTRYRSE